MNSTTSNGKTHLEQIGRIAPEVEINVVWSLVPSVRYRIHIAKVKEAFVVYNLIEQAGKSWTEKLGA